MNSRITSNSEPIEHKISRSICDAVGERLQQNFRPDSSHLSARSTISRTRLHIFCPRSHPYPFRKELVYARPGLHFVRFNRDLDGSGG